MGEALMEGAEPQVGEEPPASVEGASRPSKGQRRRYTRDDLLALRDSPSQVHEVCMSIPPEIDVNGKGLTTEKGRELRTAPFGSGGEWSRDVLPAGFGADKGIRGKRDYPGPVYKYTKEEMLAVSKKIGKSQHVRPEDLPANLCRSEPGNISEDAKRDRATRDRGDRGDRNRERGFSGRDGIPVPRDREERQGKQNRERERDNTDRTILGRKISNDRRKKNEPEWADSSDSHSGYKEVCGMPGLMEVNGQEVTKGFQQRTEMAEFDFSQSAQMRHIFAEGEKELKPFYMSDEPSSGAETQNDSADFFKQFSQPGTDPLGGLLTFGAEAPATTTPASAPASAAQATSRRSRFFPMNAEPEAPQQPPPQEEQMDSGRNLLAMLQG